MQIRKTLALTCEHLEGIEQAWAFVPVDLQGAGQACKPCQHNKSIASAVWSGAPVDRAPVSTPEMAEDLAQKAKRTLAKTSDSFRWVRPEVRSMPG